MLVFNCLLSDISISGFQVLVFSFHTPLLSLAKRTKIANIEYENIETYIVLLFKVQ